ncbi:hypothetical protein TeGR_g13655 [Tetraparma gracilis]|jgi:hypothetical protein|uniref:Uncharacterized protein n=1 Tax=Tetraparma gracilis TaxID=2962635 RepID=A0ABQ6N513_9STRA|nr:hypothetical protein TeGR_g13655 [Tetraparma gracilis]
MIAEVASSGDAITTADGSSMAVLVRGCDPVMAQRAGLMLPPLLGGAQLVSATDDDSFFQLLDSRKFDAVLFAPGACRFSAAKQTIPGGNAATRHWTLEEYRAKVLETQGAEVPIVETVEERLIVPLTRKALGLD